MNETLARTLTKGSARIRQSRNEVERLLARLLLPGIRAGCAREGFAPRLKLEERITHDSGRSQHLR
jgi:hypothetical protein